MDGLAAGAAELAQDGGAAPEVLDIAIEGMTCASCAGRVEPAPRVELRPSKRPGASHGFPVARQGRLPTAPALLAPLSAELRSDLAFSRAVSAKRVVLIPV